MSYDDDAAIRSHLFDEPGYPSRRRKPRRTKPQIVLATSNAVALDERRTFAHAEAFARKALTAISRPYHNRGMLSIVPDARAYYISASADTRATSTPTPVPLNEVSIDKHSIESVRTALRVAHDRSDATLPGWLIGALEGEVRDQAVRELLIDFSELVAWPADQYPRVVAALWRHALVIRDARPADYDRPLSVALRTIARIAPLRKADDLTAFLRPSDPPRTKHAALAAARTLFSAEPPIDEQPILWTRLTQLLDKYLDPEFAASVEVNALALNTLIAAATSGLPQLADYGAKANAYLVPLMKWQLADELREVREHWQSRTPEKSSSPAAQRLLEMIGQLGGG